MSNPTLGHNRPISACSGQKFDLRRDTQQHWQRPQPHSPRAVYPDIAQQMNKVQPRSSPCWTLHGTCSGTADTSMSLRSPLSVSMSEILPLRTSALRRGACLCAITCTAESRSIWLTSEQRQTVPRLGTNERKRRACTASAASFGSPLLLLVNFELCVRPSAHISSEMQMPHLVRLWLRASMCACV